MNKRQVAKDITVAALLVAFTLTFLVFLAQSPYKSTVKMEAEPNETICAEVDGVRYCETKYDTEISHETTTVGDVWREKARELMEMIRIECGICG